MTISNILDLKGHMNAKLIPKSEIQSYMNYLSLEPVLFEKLHNIKLAQSVFRVTMFNSMKAALSILLHYMHDFHENLKT